MQVAMPVRCVPRAVWIVAGAIAASFAHSGPYDPGPDQEPIPLKPFAEFVADVGDRSRRVIYSAYPVSAEQGVVRGFVHVSDGTAVVARTDLVVDAQMPIVLRRAYHSARASSDDFGASGWQLTIAERIERRNSDRLEYIYGNGATIELDKKGRIRSALQEYLSDVSAGRTVDDDTAIEVATRTGLLKRFARAGNAYRLVSVEDAYGNHLELRYSSLGKLWQIVSSSGTSVTLTRDDAGRIKSIRDSHGRSVHYGYDSLGRLEHVTDPGEHVWHYSYDAANRLVATTTPNDFNDVQFRYGRSGRVVLSRAYGIRNSFEYSRARTVVTDAHGLATAYVAAPSGLTTQVTNALVRRPPFGWAIPACRPHWTAMAFGSPISPADSEVKSTQLR